MRGVQGYFPIFLSAQLARGACKGECLRNIWLLVSAHSRKFQRLRYLTCKKRERIW